MLSKFLSKSKMLLIPTSWLNAVASALNTFRSPMDTISAKLAGDGESSHIDIDIKPDAVAREIQHELEANFIRKGCSSLLGPGLKWTENGLTVDLEWLARATSKM